MSSRFAAFLALAGSVAAMSLSACHSTLHTGKSGNGGSSGTGGSAGNSGLGGGTSTLGAGGSNGGAPGAGGVLGSGGASGRGAAGGAGGSVGAGGSLATELVETRPARPAWTPPFTAILATPGWQQSTQPLCDRNQGLFAVYDLWADERGVFAAMGEGCNVLAGAACGKDGVSVKLNAGTGWQLLYQFVPGSAANPGLLSAFPSGPLIMDGGFDTTGSGQPDKFGYAFVDKGSFTFQSEASSANGAFAVSKDLAYAIDDTRLLMYSAGTWSSLGDAGSPLLAVWADSQTVIAAGQNQTVVMKQGTGPLTALMGVPAGDYRALWAFAANDIWLGNTALQLVHYDGSKWQAYDTGSRDISGSGIAQLWGVPGALYFRTAAEFARWNGSKVEMLLEPPAGADLSIYAGSFGRFWGRSANDIFIPLWDRRYQQYACGGVFALWFDGTQFHQF